jgi:fatty-acyl-CoA synthase
LKREADTLAAGLLAIGLSSGDHVMLWGANHAHLIVAVYACARAGLVFSNLNHSFGQDMVLDHLNMADSKAIICFPTVKPGNCYNILTLVTPEIKDSALGHMQSRNLPKLSHVIIAEEQFAYPGCYKLSYVFSLGAKPENQSALIAATENIKPDDLASIQITSATTGASKAVMLSHFQVVNAAKVAGQRLYLDQPGEALCCAMPVFRGPVLCTAVMATAVIGAKVVYPGSGPPAIFQAIQDEKCTCLLSNPIALHLMLRMPVVKKFKIESLSAVCLIFDHVPPDLITAMQKCTKIGDVTVGLALTECGGMPVMFPMDGKPDKLMKTTGQVAANFEAKIVDFNNAVAKIGQPGELYVKTIGNSKFLGYYKNNELTKTVVDGWIRTGDVGIMDAEGYVTLIDRTNDIIFHKKKPIFPTVIERKLSTYSSVIGAQVVGVKDAECGEKICAFVILKEKEGLDEDKVRRDLIEICKEEKLNEPNYVIFVKDFPRTVSKKIQKFKLKAMAPELISKK